MNWILIRFLKLRQLPLDPKLCLGLLLAVSFIGAASFADGGQLPTPSDSMWIDYFEKFERFTDSGKKYSQKEQTCPKALTDLVFDDPKNSLLGTLKSSDQTCSQGFHTQMDANPFQLLEIYKNKDSHLQDPMIMGRLISCAKQYSPEVANKMISKYFSNQKRLEQASLLRLSEIAGIDSILRNQETPPSPRLAEICSRSPFRSVLKRCEFFLHQCSPTENLQTLSQQTAQALDEIATLKNEIAQLENRKSLPSTQDQQNQLRIQISLKKLEIDGKEKVMPWLTGDRFKQKLLAKHSISDAILSQLRENRVHLIEEYQQLQGASRCYRGSEGAECRPQALRKTLARTPSLPNRFREDMKEFSSKEAWLSYHEYESYQECITDMKISQDDTDQVISEAVIGTAAGFAFGGLGTAANSARIAKALKDLAQLAIGISQADWFVTEAEGAYRACLQKTQTLAIKNSSLEEKMQCPRPAQNISQTLAMDSCYQQAALTALSGLSLGLMKISVNAPHSHSLASPPNWRPKNAQELGNYFALHNREVNSNAHKIFEKYKSAFPHLSKKDLHLLESHDLEKFSLSFNKMKEKYNYQGIPKDIIEGLKDKERYLPLLSKDGKHVEMTVNEGLFLLWGHSRESLVEKMKLVRQNGKNVDQEVQHLESLIKLREYIVSSMKTLDDKIMNSVLSKLPTAEARVEMRVLEFLSDSAARNANPITQIEFGRPTLSTFDYIKSQGGLEWVIKKFADPDSKSEIIAAENLLKNMGGLPGLQRITEMLEKTYRPSGSPDEIRNALRKMYLNSLNN